jgi:predicted Abi (CAAX) family protease
LSSALLVLATPALGEELLFRAVLTPSREEQPDDVAALFPSTIAFTLWHVLTALTILPSARPIFLRPDFLAIAALEGLVCGWLRRRTGSVWPGVALHWAEVMVWKTWLGGPDLADLAQAPGKVGSSSRRPRAMSR